MRRPSLGAAEYGATLLATGRIHAAAATVLLALAVLAAPASAASPLQQGISNVWAAMEWRGSKAAVQRRNALIAHPYGDAFAQSVHAAIGVHQAAIPT